MRVQGGRGGSGVAGQILGSRRVVNLKQLSEALGLSQTTVSRALNGYPDVSEATRARVVEMADRLGYKANTVARRLALGKADAVGLVYPLDSVDLGDPRFLELLQGLTDVLNEREIDLLIASAGRRDELVTYEHLMRGHRVDAFVVARTRLEDSRIEFLRRSGFPFVAYGRTSDSAAFPWFDFDNELGTRLAVQRLVSFGHRRIGYVHASLGLTFAHQRYAGYRSAMGEAGLTVETRHVIEAGMAPRRAYDAMQALLRGSEPPTAVIVDNNLAGIGVVRALDDAGLTPGKECSVIVYDGIRNEALLAHEQVTSIDQHTPYAAGQQLAEMALACLQGRPAEQLQVLWTPRITPGFSDGPVLNR